MPEDAIIQDAIEAEESQLVHNGLHIHETVLEDTKIINRKPPPVKPSSTTRDQPQPPADAFPDFQHSFDSPEYLRKTNKKWLQSITQQPKELYIGNTPLPRRPLETVPPALPARRNVENLMPPLPPRRLQGPRPLHTRNESADTATLGRDLRKENANPRRWSAQPDTIVEHGIHPLSSSEVTELGTFQRSETTFSSITLIRRDPSTGEQWNVGRIMGGSRPGIGNALGHQTQGLLDQVEVELDTPGYLKLSDTRSSDDGYALSETRKFELGPFRRSIDLGSSKSVVKTPSPRRSEFGFNTTGTESRHSLDSSRPYSQANYSHGEDNHRRPQYFSFLSPWQGKCTFSTSATGKSIKCRHMLPPELIQRPINTSLDPASILVSELRFNLPNSTTFRLRTQDYKRPSLSKFSRSAWSNSHPQLPPRPHGGLHTSESMANDDTSPEEDKMDLSLGQERAGGGFGGKKAKLGKLILECEGLKMLDLLVAVNMAIWWKVYE